MDGGDPGRFGHDAQQKRVGLIDSAAARRAEALQALRGWKWLEALRIRFELPIEIIGADVGYIFDPIQEPHGSAALRNALLRLDPTVLAAGVMRSGKAHGRTVGDLRVRLFPLSLRSGPSPTAVAALVIGETHSDSFDLIDRRLDATGQWLTSAIEASLVDAFAQSAEVRRLERTAGSIDVIDALTKLESDSEIIALMVDAIALWYDADVYAYHQDLSGAFALSMTLPGSDAARVAPLLLGHHIWGRGEVFSPGSRHELDELGWSAAMGPTLFVPITVDQSVEWLLAVSEGSDDPSMRQTLDVFGRVAGMLLSDLQRQAVERLARKLNSILLFGAAPFQATTRMALEAVAVETGASSVQFGTFDFEEGRARPVLSIQWGGADTDLTPFVDAETTRLSAGAIAVGIEAGSGVTAVLSVKRETAFAPLAQRLARSAASAIAVWLSGSLLRAADLRAPESAEYGAELVQRLRNQVDRFGHVNVGGAVAVVLPQGQTGAAPPIDEAVALIEHHVRPSDVIGAVGVTGAGVLLREATQDVAAAVVGRLLRAARDQRSWAVRVGVAMFAASSESPEAVLERALMNARRGSV